MAPSPENDNTPKAPDKNRIKETQKSQNSWCNSNEKRDKNISVTSLDDGQLKALLDEAITYKIPKDRHGKSELFKTLLSDAEDEIRKAHAQSASGPELARYYNTTAKSKNRSKRQKSSVSENLTHGGSLDDLVNEEHYMQRPKKTVSTRQREGGSLPCNVNAEVLYNKQFFLEEQEKRKNKIHIQDIVIDMESESLLANDSLGQEYSNDKEEIAEEVKPCINKVFKTLSDYSEVKRHQDKLNSVLHPNEERYTDVGPYNLLPMNAKWPFNSARTAAIEEKKVDENGNALSQNSANDSKKRKKSGKKAEDVIKAEDVKGHRADIIDNIDRLVEFISGTEDKPKGPVKTKLNKHVPEGKQKQRTRSSKGSKTATNHHLQKSNSMEEISTTKLEDFHFDQEHGKSESSKVPLRSTKSNAERPRERKSWVLCSELYQNASAENLESADFTFVTKKKKSKKRRNSLGSRKQPYSSEVRPAEFHRVPSPRRKSVCSVPHSEKSNDSSDADSVHSLPLDSVDGEPLNLPISYADIAKSVDKPKLSRPATLERKKDVDHVKSPNAKIETDFKETVTVTNVKQNDVLHVNNKNDLNSLQNWPEIRNNKVNCVKKNLENVQDWPTIQNNVGVKNEKTPQKINNVRNYKTPPKREDHLEHFGQANCAKDTHILSNTQQVIQKVSEQHQLMFPCQMPPNIRDVQSIEKMQLKNLHSSPYNNNNGSGELEESPVVMAPLCEIDKRPAVVILSGGDKDVSDITFGFDINEQLLSGDVCADFTSRFFLPEMKQPMNVDKLVNFIGSEWEEILAQTRSGGNNVKYYSEDL